MIGKDRLLSTLQKVLKKAGADQAEAVFLGGESGLTRYANSTIHQNVTERNHKIYFRVALGKKIGVAATNSMTPDDLQLALGNALTIAKQQRANPDFTSFPAKAKYPKVRTHFKATGAFTPKERALAVKKAIEKAARHNLQIYGSFATGEGELAVANSLGVAAYQPLSNAALNLIAMGDSSSGYADGLSRDVREVNIDSIAETAIQKCLDSSNPKDFPPGTYEVILEPAAVANLMEWMSFVSFGSKAFQEQTSCLAGKIGQKIMADSVTIYDDGGDEGGAALPFDFEGVPKKKVVFVDRGVAKGVVYDTLAANREKKKSTGHALTPDSASEGAIPVNIFIKGSTSSLKKMIANCERGLLVTRFHYINGLLDPPNAAMTGMTRDGTFLVEGGKIKHGIKNLRFTESMVKAFSQVAEISRERNRVAAWWESIGCITTPAVRITRFAFTGKTDF